MRTHYRHKIEDGMGIAYRFDTTNRRIVAASCRVYPGGDPVTGGTAADQYSRSMARRILDSRLDNSRALPPHERATLSFESMGLNDVPKNAQEYRVLEDDLHALFENTFEAHQEEDWQ